MNTSTETTPMGTRTLAAIAIILLAATASTALAQHKSAADTITPRFTVGSLRTVAGYARFDFAELDARLAANGLPGIAQSAATVGVGTDVRFGRLLLGAGFQTLVTRDHKNDAYRMRLAGAYTLLDVGVAAASGHGWSVYPLAGLGLTSLRLNVRERGEFTFDEAMARPSRELGMSTVGGVAHAAVLVERRLRFRAIDYALSVRAGVSRTLGGQVWMSDASTLDGGPNGIRGSYVRLAFSRPLRRRREAILPAAGTIAQAIAR